MTSASTSHRADDRHVCPAHGCQRQLPTRLFMCPPHWRVVPAVLRAALWRASRPGQKHEARPSPEYLAAAREAIDAVAARDRRWAR